MTPELLDAWLRLLRLTQMPADIPVLAAANEREILCRVLMGPQGWVLRAIARPDSALSQIRRAVAWIRTHFAEPFSAQGLAAVAGMSVSAFHRHFKAATSLSPLQYQKNVRLLHARTLLVAGASSATSVAFEVGYESPSQFSREYKRRFGFPPSHA